MRERSMDFSPLHPGPKPIVLTIVNTLRPFEFIVRCRYHKAVAVRRFRFPRR